MYTFIRMLLLKGKVKDRVVVFLFLPYKEWEIKKKIHFIIQLASYPPHGNGKM